jgi:hypothetical protein
MPSFVTTLTPMYLQILAQTRSACAAATLFHSLRGAKSARVRWRACVLAFDLHLMPLLQISFCHYDLCATIKRRNGIPDEDYDTQ